MRGTARRDPIWGALALAALLHVGLLAVERVAPEGHAPPVALVDTTKGDTFDIETVPLPGGPSAPPRPSEPPAEQASPRAERAAQEVPGAARAKVAAAPALNEPSIPSKSPSIQEESPPSPAQPPPGTPGEGPAAPGEPGQPPAAAGPPSDSFSPPEAPGSGVLGVPGLNGTPVWAIPGVVASAPAAAPAPTAPIAPRPVDSDIAGQVLSGSQHKRDQALGIDLPAGGVVASTLASAVRGSEAPGDARATFEVRLGADGKVQGVRVVSATTGKADTWDRVARRVAADLGARALAMTGDAAARGATVTVKIESKIVYPAGSKEKIDVQPVCAEEVIEEMARSISEGTAGEPSRGPINDPAMNRPDPGKLLPSAEDEERKRLFCIPIGIKGKGDISNIGAHTQKVVRSSFKVSIPGTKALEDVKKVDKRAPWSPEDPNKVKPIRPKRPKKKKRP